jgi:hypothetical protein
MIGRVEVALSAAPPNGKLDMQKILSTIERLQGYSFPASR